ncbi:hypothetical protein QFZ75_008113 [Streptomyces sp. V3I8]|nr:hypothetical protein [Streptomyces sp. V3I8]
MKNVVMEGGRLRGERLHEALICDHRSLVLLVMVTPADAQDSPAARELLFRLALIHPEMSEVLITWACITLMGRRNGRMRVMS